MHIYLNLEDGHVKKAQIMDAQMSTLLPSLTSTMEVEVCVLPICAFLRLAVTTANYMFVFLSLILKLTWFHSGNYLCATCLCLIEVLAG